MMYAFTTRYGRRVSALRTKVAILSFSTESDIESSSKEYTAIGDTGATNSVISQKVVNDLNLKPIDVTKIHHANGTSIVNVYLVNIGLPSRIMMGNIEVTDAELTDRDGVADEDQTRVIIGMDIIGEGDLAVTNVGGKTVLSFRMPSVEEIDFTPSK
jgi:predicted aspartyl protease